MFSTSHLSKGTEGILWLNSCPVSQISTSHHITSWALSQPTLPGAAHTEGKVFSVSMRDLAHARSRPPRPHPSASSILGLVGWGERAPRGRAGQGRACCGCGAQRRRRAPDKSCSWCDCLGTRLIHKPRVLLNPHICLQKDYTNNFYIFIKEFRLKQEDFS